MGKKVKVTIHEFIKNRGLSLRELSRLTDIRHATLSELSNDKRKNINLNHIERIAEAFDLNDTNELIKIIDVEDKED